MVSQLSRKRLPLKDSILLDNPIGPSFLELPARVSNPHSLGSDSVIAPPTRGPRGLPSPMARILMVLGGMKAAFVRPPPRDLGVRGASIVRCGLSCLVDLNSD